jgi:hypothetical protein
MAKSQYNGDSQFPSQISERPGMSASLEIILVKPAFVPAMPAIEASPVPTPYILTGGPAIYIGESTDCARRLRDHGAADAMLCPDGISPSTTTTRSID